MRFLAVEDNPTTTAGTTAALSRLGHKVIPARSTLEARELLDTERVDAVLLDRRVPIEIGGAEASEEEMFSLASDIAEGRFDANPALEFLWLTAYADEAARMDVPGCLGIVRKSSGDATAQVTQLFAAAVEGFFDAAPEEAIQEQVLVELRLSEQTGVVVNVPAWEPELDFLILPTELPDWIGVALKAARGAPVYLRARADLRATRAEELDLSAFAFLPQTQVDAEVLWDD